MARHTEVTAVIAEDSDSTYDCGVSFGFSRLLLLQSWFFFSDEPCFLGILGEGASEIFKGSILRGKDKRDLGRKYLGVEERSGC